MSESAKARNLELFLDLGVITVGESYAHEGRLNAFKEKFAPNFCYYDGAITDKNFKRPSRIVRPGDQFWVLTYKQVGDDKKSAQEWVEFLKAQEGNVFVGAQGISLVVEQKLEQLPGDHRFASFDETEGCWNDEGFHGFACVHVHEDRELELMAAYLEGDLHNKIIAFQFIDLGRAS